MKLRVLLLVLLILVMSVGSGFAAEFERGKLDELHIRKGASSFSFTGDVMGIGTDQTVKISKDKYGDYNITISQNEEILTSINFMALTKKQNILLQEKWFLAYLRQDNIPYIIYFFVDGSGAFLNDFKIFGINKEKDFDMVFDAEPHSFPREIGGQTQLLINDTQLILTGKDGQVTIKLDEIEQN